MIPGIEQKVRLTGHSGSIYTLEPYQDKKFFSGASDGIVARWDSEQTDSGEATLSLKDAVYSIKYIQDVNKLLVGQAKGGIHVIDLTSGIEEKLLQLHTGPVFTINYNPKYKLLFTGGSDGTVKVLNHSFELIQTFELSKSKIRNIIFSFNNDQCIIGCGDGSICIIALPGFQTVKQWLAHQPGFGVNALCVSPDGKYLLSGSRDAILNIYNASTFELIKSIPAHNYAIYDIAYHNSGKIVATASRDKTVKLWNAENFEVVARLDKDTYDGHKNSVNKLMWIGDDLITAGDDRSIIIWKMEY